jgi:hypothetical protein
MREITSVGYRRERRRVAVADLRLVDCRFDNCRGVGGAVSNVHVVNGYVWSCGLHDVVLDGCDIEGLRMTLPGPGGGKRMPLIVDGLLARHVRLSGKIGSLIWNPPHLEHGVHRSQEDAWVVARSFYEGVDWALDVREARFTSAPSLRYGPPGCLVRRDPTTQPLVTRRAATRALDEASKEIGVWAYALKAFLKQPWLDDFVLIPASGASKANRRKEEAGLQVLHDLGAFNDDPGTSP